MKNLGGAQEFNIYVLNDHKQSNVDSEGRVAVTNNAQYSNYGIGNKTEFSTTRNDLIVGGTMDITNGTNFNGNSIIQDSNNIIKYTMTNNNGVMPQPIEDISLDFKAINKYLSCTSVNWSLITPNGTAKVEYGGLTLTGEDENLNVFFIDGTNIENSGYTLSKLNKIDVIAPKSSTILINISGEELGFGSYGIFRNGVTATGDDGRFILWNLFEANIINPGTTSVKGTLLAPLATYNSGYTNIEGNLIVYNLYGNIEAHNYLFNGELPVVCQDEPTEIICYRQQAISDIIESVALQQTGLSHILNASAETISLTLNGGENLDYILKLNNSVTDIINSINKLEVILSLKLSLFDSCYNCRK